jgi:hypothetical protein
MPAQINQGRAFIKMGEMDDEGSNEVITLLASQLATASLMVKLD